MIRPANRGDIEDIVRIHMESFRSFFLTFLGEDFLALMYTAIHDDPGGILLVADSASGPEGFVAGVTEQTDFYLRLLREQTWRFARAALRPAIRRPSIIPRVFRALRRPAESRRAAAEACLMSLAVRPQTEGRGVGGALVEAFCSAAAERGSTSVSLTTDREGNDRVLRFYEGRGFRLVRSFLTPEGRAINEYIRENPRMPS